jgi:cephalosporin-C deacetylase
MTSGIASPETYYYRFVYMDAVRTLELLSQLEGVDGERVAVCGASQGGGLTIAAAALCDRARFAWSDIPFLCDFPRSIDIVEKRPYSEISDFLRARPDRREAARRTLSYFDGLNLASSVACPTVLTVALWDDVCPPSSAYGTFAQLGCVSKRLEVLPYSRHEGTYELTEHRLSGLAEFARPS